MFVILTGADGAIFSLGFSGELIARLSSTPRVKRALLGDLSSGDELLVVGNCF